MAWNLTPEKPHSEGGQHTEVFDPGVDGEVFTSEPQEEGNDFLPCLPWVWSVYPLCTLGSEVSTCHVINVPGFHLFSKPVVTCALDSHQWIRGSRVC